MVEIGQQPYTENPGQGSQTNQPPPYQQQYPRQRHQAQQSRQPDQYQYHRQHSDQGHDSQHFQHQHHHHQHYTSNFDQNQPSGHGSQQVPSSSNNTALDDLVFNLWQTVLAVTSKIFHHVSSWTQQNTVFQYLNRRYPHLTLHRFGLNLQPSIYIPAVIGLLFPTLMFYGVLSFVIGKAAFDQDSQRFQIMRHRGMKIIPVFFVMSFILPWPLSGLVWKVMKLTFWAACWSRITMNFSQYLVHQHQRQTNGRTYSHTIGSWRKQMFKCGLPLVAMLFTGGLVSIMACGISIFLLRSYRTNLRHAHQANAPPSHNPQQHQHKHPPSHNPQQHQHEHPPSYAQYTNHAHNQQHHQSHHSESPQFPQYHYNPQQGFWSDVTSW